MKKSGGSGCLKTYEYVGETNIKKDFLYSSSTYAGVYISDKKRLIELEENFIKNAETTIKKLFKDEPYIVIKSYQKEYPEILNTRLCISGLIDLKKTKSLGVIWFDDGQKDISDSLEDIFDQIDWSLSREFEY